jgi:lipopolysaccharide/colanic/teichoic acid biosynthesis glycosyltransferase
MSDIYGGSTRFYPRARDAARSGLPLHTNDDQAGFTGVSLHHGLPLARQGGAPVAPSFDRAARRQLLLKRVLLDIPMSALALLVLSPLLLVIAAAIRFSSRGPIIFRQTRVGLDGADFTLFKFRTIAEKRGDDSGGDQVVADDERVTPIGRLLRATSLDELPQLWNILVGDMAVIGPRPMVRGQLAAGRDYRELVPYYDYRTLVRPGLSGWAQANGLRGSTKDPAAARERIDHDCAYVQNFSLGLDLKIIVITIAREFLTGSGS